MNKNRNNTIKIGMIDINEIIVYNEVVGNIGEPYASKKRFYEYVTNEPQIKAVLAGHLYFDFGCRLPSGAMQFVTNRGDKGNAREIIIL